MYYYTKRSKGQRTQEKQFIVHLLIHSFSFSRQEKKALKSTESDVIICALGHATIVDSMAIASLLWSKGIPAEYVHHEWAMDELQLHCKQTGIRWMVILKSPLGHVPTKASIKLKNVDTNAEMQIVVKELGDFLLAAASGKQKDVSGSIERESQTVETTPVAGAALKSQATANPVQSLNIVVLDQDMRSKKKKQISSDVQRAILPTLKAFTYSTAFTAIAVEMPWTIVREIASSTVDIVNDVQYHTFVSKHPRYRSSIMSLRDTLTKIRADTKTAPIIFVYSYADNKWEVLVYKKH